MSFCLQMLLHSFFFIRFLFQFMYLLCIYLFCIYFCPATSKFPPLGINKGVSHLILSQIQTTEPNTEKTTRASRHFHQFLVFSGNLCCAKFILCNLQPFCVWLCFQYWQSNCRGCYVLHLLVTFVWGVLCVRLPVLCLE